MNATEVPLHRFLSYPSTRFLIPVYQRNYDWKYKQCAQLLSDIRSNSNSQNATPYFIGSIVHTSQSNLASLRELVIIDGQQRITTINLLLLAICNVFKNANDTRYEEIWDQYLQNKYLDEGTKLKLKPVQKDEKAYYNLVNDNIDLVESGNRILENYKYFVDIVSTVEIASEIYEGFKRLSIVEIGLDEKDDAQKIFQSLNSTGLDLSQADLIRNYILMNLTPTQQETIYNKYWSTIENNTYAKNTDTNKLSEFFRDFITLKYKQTPAFRSIFDSFKQRYVFNATDISYLEQVLEDIKSYTPNTILNS